MQQSTKMTPLYESTGLESRVGKFLGCLMLYQIDLRMAYVHKFVRQGAAMCILGRLVAKSRVDFITKIFIIRHQWCLQILRIQGVIYL